MAAAIKVLHTSHGLSWLHILALHIEIIDSLFIYNNIIRFHILCCIQEKIFIAIVATKDVSYERKIYLQVGRC